MAGERSWFSTYIDDAARDSKLDSFSELRSKGNEEVQAVSMDLILPDDLLGRILSFLPVASLLRAGAVCKRWHEIISSRRFLWNFSESSWYFMFRSSDEPIGFAYDPILRKWYAIDLPCIRKPDWLVVSSFGLVCCTDNDRRNKLYVCNPITKSYRKIREPPGMRFPDYSALAMSVNKASHGYTISVVKSKHAQEDFLQWDISIHIYRSEMKTWSTSCKEVLRGWRGSNESAICDGVLYFMIYASGGGVTGARHVVVKHNLFKKSLCGLSPSDFINVPFSLSCCRLMNMRERLVMVGGICKPDRVDCIKGISIWGLNGTQWDEIARIPPRFLQGFGELDDVFASRGSHDLIYIHSYGSPALLIFDMDQKQWKWAHKSPVSKKFPLQLFTGFCFQPMLEIQP